MPAIDPNRVQAVFLLAADAPGATAREAILERECGADAELRRRVVELLGAHDQSGSFLERPIVQPVPMGDTLPPEPRPASAGNAAPTTNDLGVSPGTVIAGRFRLLELIGEGGMGAVWRSEQREPVKRLVALKLIKPGMDSRQVLSRFEAERQALALMDHPSIAKVFDGGMTDQGRPYFVMEYVKGIPITTYCDDARLSLKDRLAIFMQVCEAVQHAHQKGIIHRDLKPSNILVCLYDGKPVPKVIDFGLAKAMHQSLTEHTLYTAHGLMVGTPLYMSPEQAEFNNLDIDTRSDVYSLGVILYELLTGTTPLEKQQFKDAVLQEVLRLIKEEEPQKPSTRLSSLSLGERAGVRAPSSLASIAAQRSLEPAQLSRAVRGDLDWIVMKSLEKERSRRYETASSLARDIDRYLHDEPVEACPPSAVYRFRKFARRNKTGLAIAGLILFFLVFIGGGMGWALRDRAVRQAALEQGVTSALDDVESWHQRENWPEAIAAVKHAEALLATGQPSPALAARVAQWRTDLETATRLEDIRLADAMTEKGLRSERPALDANYQREFGALGIDIDAMTIKDAADRIRARPIHDQLIAALDSWTELRIALVSDKSDTAREKPGDWRVRPLRVARAVDTDEFRNSVRLAIEQGDAAKQIELAQSPDATRLPASTLELLSERLATAANARKLQMELLKRAQQARPDDFYLNFNLAISRSVQSKGATFYNKGGKITVGSGQNDLLLGDEAVVYAMAAVALRPRSAYAQMALAETLRRAGRLDDALSAYREAIRLQPDELRLHGNLALLLAQQGKLDEAIAIYRRLIERHPGDSVDYGNLGGLLYKLGKLDQAIAAYGKAIELTPDDAMAYSNLGIALCDQGKFTEAVAALHKAIELDPNAAAPYSSLGNALWNLRKLDESIAACRKAIELDPADAAAYNDLGRTLGTQGKLEEAIAAYRKAIELNPTLADAYGNLGYVLDSLGKYEESIAASRKAIELKPDSSDASAAYNNLGLALGQLGKLDEAVAAHRKAIELKPTLADAYLNLGTELNDLGRFEESIAAARKAIELNPNDFEAYNNLGVALRNSGNRDGAIAAYRKSIEIAPQYAAAYANLGFALHDQEKLDEAIVAYTKAIELKVDRSEVYNNLGVALQIQGKIDEAIAAFRKAIELQPGNYLPYNNLASIMATAPAPHRDPARALELAMRATELGPTAGDAWNTLGVARYRVGQWQPAIDALEKSMKLRAGGDANDWFFLAMVHWQLGHKEDARKWFDKSVEWTDKNQPDNKELRRFRDEAAKLLGITN